jgi:hypothetical protein
MEMHAMQYLWQMKAVLEKGDEESLQYLNQLDRS